MINEKMATKYCNEDLSLIENYDKASLDTERMWHCHHRAEILPCGKFSVEDLKLHGLYYNRPAQELIFLTKSDHMAIHTSGNNNPFFGKHHDDEAKKKISEAVKGKHWSLSEETKKKMSSAMKGNKRWLGRHHSEETKKKMSEAMKGHRNTLGMRWYNNGIVTIRAKECPEGFVPGRL